MKTLTTLLALLLSVAVFSQKETTIMPGLGEIYQSAPFNGFGGYTGRLTIISPDAITKFYHEAGTVFYDTTQLFKGIDTAKHTHTWIYQDWSVEDKISRESHTFLVKDTVVCAGRSRICLLYLSQQEIYANLIRPGKIPTYLDLMKRIISIDTLRVFSFDIKMDTFVRSSVNGLHRYSFQDAELRMLIPIDTVITLPHNSMNQELILDTNNFSDSVMKLEPLTGRELIIDRNNTSTFGDEPLEFSSQTPTSIFPSLTVKRTLSNHKKYHKHITKKKKVIWTIK